ncbi:hypothetical protein FPV67DRAFT_1666622 [Lyophyllum atratum]|nr:hypothetical protein FPV67DRAFT_1666622 [Lyophyllum atratum]
MFFLAVLLLGVLAFGPQVVLSLDFKFELSEVKQCEPVSITFVGNSTKAVPMRLTLVPFNSTPISIPIPNAAANTSGVYVTFFPFAAGTNFLASLEDATGENVAKVSDIIRVLPSSTGNTTCLPASNGSANNTHLTVNDSTFSQCEQFSLTYDRNVIYRAPSVRLYSPKGPSRLLNSTADDTATGIATYLMSFDRNKEVVLVFDDGFDHRQSTALITVSGDTSSSKACLELKQDDKHEVQKSSPSFGISKPVIIGASVGGGVIVLIFFLMLFFVLRERRRKQQESIHSNPSILEQGPSPNLTGPRRSPVPSSPTISEKDTSPGFVKDPPYTADKFLSPTSAFYPRQSMASWAQPTPEDQRVPSRAPSNLYSIRDDHLSLNSLDIEGILNLATVQSNRSSRQTAEPAPLGPTLHFLEPRPLVSGPRLEVSGPYPSRGHLRDPSDIPVGPTSMASALSLRSVVDPFADNVTKRPGSPRKSYRQTSLDSPIRPLPSAVIGLPSSPRNGQRINRSRGSDVSEMAQAALRSSNRSTKDSMGDYYGIAR